MGKKMTFALAFCNRGFIPGELARGGFKHHTSIGLGHMKSILEEAFTTYLGYEWVDID